MRQQGKAGHQLAVRMEAKGWDEMRVGVQSWGRGRDKEMTKGKQRGARGGERRATDEEEAMRGEQ